MGDGWLNLLDGGAGTDSCQDDLRQTLLSCNEG